MLFSFWSSLNITIITKLLGGFHAFSWSHFASILPKWEGFVQSYMSAPHPAPTALVPGEGFFNLFIFVKIVVQFF